MHKYFLLFSLLILSSCDDFNTSNTGIEVDTGRFEPIFLTRETLNNSVEFSVTQEELRTPVKIYRYGNLLLVSDHFTGIHAYDNADPSNPTKLGFIKIPGITDIAMNGNILYANNSVDLVAIDVSNINDLKIVKRIQDAFDEPLPPGFNSMPSEYKKENRKQDFIIFKWREKND